MVIAATGFVLTRFAVVNAIQQGPIIQFLLSGGLALLFGLAVIVVGIGLTMSTLPRVSVNTIARWCLVGSGSMAIITGIALAEATLFGRTDSAVAVWTSSFATNGLIGGAVGGVIIGVYSVRTDEHRRELALKVDQATLLNRIVRDKVLNKATVIRANVDLLRDDGRDPSRLDVVDQSADQLEEAVEDIGFLARSETRAELDLEAIDLAGMIEDSIERVRREHPDVTFEFQHDGSSDPTILGESRLGTVFDRLFAHVIDRDGGRTDRFSVFLESDERTTTVRVENPHVSLSEAERNLLVDGTLPEYDDPTMGFNLPIVRLLVTLYGGEIQLDGVDSSTATAIVFPRATEQNEGTVAGIPTGLYYRQFVDTAGASLVGGLAMGVVLQRLTDVMPAIGGLYGVQSLTIGWILHLFHSLVFGILFVALFEGPLLGKAHSIRRHASFGVGYGLVLWLLAAGIVMPVWLNLVGIQSEIPRLRFASLLGHVTWGALLGGLYYLLANRRRGWD